MERKKILRVTDPPDGLFYLPEFVSASEEQLLLDNVMQLPFSPYIHHGYVAKRNVVYFGNQSGYNSTKKTWDNGEDRGKVSECLPDWLTSLRIRCAQLINLAAEELEMAMVAQYNCGAGIGWHRDAPHFGSIIGISLCADAKMRFRKFIDNRQEMYHISLQPRSAYIISGAARSAWQHGMPPVEQLRYSITFRTIRDRQHRRSEDGRQTAERIAQHLARLHFKDGLPKADGTVIPPECQQLSLGFSPRLFQKSR